MSWKTSTKLVVIAALAVLVGCTAKKPEQKAEKAADTKTKAEGTKTETTSTAAKTKAPAKADAKKPAKPMAASFDLSKIPNVIAKVNGVDIQKKEFIEKYSKMTKAFTARNRPIPETLASRYRDSILKQIVDKELLTQEIKKQGVNPDAKQIADGYENYKKMFRTPENFKKYLESSGMSEEQIRGNIVTKKPSNHSSVNRVPQGR